MITPEIDVFVTNYTMVDPQIMQLWIQGYTANEAVNLVRQTDRDELLASVPKELIISDVHDHYRTYSLIEPYMYTPIKLLEQSCFQLTTTARCQIIEKYYSLDDAVAREFLGKKLSSRYRKDLDELAEKTGLKLKSCCRQFDNVKRIFKAVEDLPGNITSNIKQMFLISDGLARKYGVIVFLAFLRFETSKKRLQYLSFQDLFVCSQAIMSHWTYMYQHPGADGMDIEMDKEFLLDLRELRHLLDKEKEIKHLVCWRLKPILLERIYHELEVNFRSYWRSIIGIAVNLHRSRELRDLFVDLCEKLIEPWRQCGLTRDQVNAFTLALTQSVSDLEISREHETRCLWDRYMQVIAVCLNTMYPS